MITISTEGMEIVIRNQEKSFHYSTIEIALDHVRMLIYREQGFTKVVHNKDGTWTVSKD